MCEINNEQTKKCTTCNEIKSVSEFGKKSRNKDGLQNSCKLCLNKHNANYILKKYGKPEHKYKCEEGFKICRKCNIKKPHSDFSLYKNNNDGYQAQCKLCLKEYRDSDKERAKSYRDKYRINNPDKDKQSKVEYENRNRDKINKRKSNYRKENREKINKQRKERYDNDAMYKMVHNVRGRIKSAFKYKSWGKNTITQHLVGCDYNFLKEYLKSMFIEHMSWDNHGEWEIDHIIPLATAKTVEELEKLCHYTNLQPLWKEDNHVKKDKLDYVLPEKYNQRNKTNN